MAKRPTKKPTGKAVAVRKKKTPANGEANLRKGNPDNARLTERNKRFIEEYKIDLNGTKAAIRAGYSERSAHSTACNLLKNPKVAAVLATARQEWQDRVGITQDAILHELAALGFSRASTFVRETDGGEIKVDLSDASERDMAAIKSIESVTTVSSSGDGQGGTSEVTKTKITLHDKRLPLRDIGQHLGMFKDDSAPQGVVINVKEIKLIGVLPDGRVYDCDEILQVV